MSMGRRSVMTGMDRGGWESGSDEEKDDVDEGGLMMRMMKSMIIEG